MQPNANPSDTLLPRAVRLQVKAMNERIEARSAAGAAPAPGPTAPAAAPTATNEPPAAAPNAAPVAPAPPAPSAPPLSTADARESSVDYWRDRFSVMQGVNAKLRTDHADALEVRDRELTELRQRVKTLEQASSSAQQSDKIDLKVFFTPEQIERFGEDQCEAMAHAAVKAAGQQAQHIIDAEVKPLKERHDADDAAKVKKANETFFSNLDELVAKIPEAGKRSIWEINSDQAWLEFLGGTDADGEPRQGRLNRLQRSMNAQGVANLVKEYLQTANPKPPAPPVAPGGGSGNGGDQLPNQGASVNGKGYPTAAEFKDYSQRAATIRNARDPRFVTSKEREEMEARLRLPRPAAR